MRTLDLAILFLYLVGILLLGIAVSRRKQSKAEYLVAGLMASTMSSVDSGIHSCSTAVTTDFLKPAQAETDDYDLRLDRWLTLILGLAATVLGCWVGQLGTIFEVANRVINGLGSPLLAIMLLGVFSRSVTARGLLWGGMVGTCVSILVSIFLSPIALHYVAVVNLLVTLLACYGFSAGGVETQSQR